MFVASYFCNEKKNWIQGTDRLVSRGPLPPEACQFSIHAAAVKLESDIFKSSTSYSHIQILIFVNETFKLNPLSVNMYMYTTYK